jgi:hypothetical protein
MSGSNPQVSPPSPARHRSRWRSSRPLSGGVHKEKILFVTIVTTVTSNDLIEGSRTPQHPPATPANNITFLELKWGPAGGDTGDDARTVTP